PFDDFGKLEAVTGGMRYTNKFGVQWNYDSLGLLQTIVDPHNLAITFTYSSGHHPLTAALPDGGIASFGYSGNQITAISEPGSHTVTLQYSGANQTGSTDVDDTSRSFGYDS